VDWPPRRGLSDQSGAAAGGEVIERGEQFLLCPECDSVWLPDSRSGPYNLETLFACEQFRPGEVAWDFIEPV
jgi:hypothetical protein